MDITKEDKILQEIKRLNNIFGKLDLKIKKSVKSLIENCAFMYITLQELQEAINKKGCVEIYTNGANQSGLKKSSEIEIYNTMIKNYSSIVKQLTDLLPKTETAKIDDGFDAFVSQK